MNETIELRVWTDATPEAGVTLAAGNPAAVSFLEGIARVLTDHALVNRWTAGPRSDLLDRFGDDHPLDPASIEIRSALEEAAASAIGEAGADWSVIGRHGMSLAS